MGNGGSNTGDVFDVRKVRRFVELMKEHELAEIDLRDGERRIRLRSGCDVPPSHSGFPAHAAAAPSATPGPGATSPPASDAASAASDALFVTSPMVGTFYTAANPDAAPFVKIGDQVGKDTVVCIIEAMKVFNEVPAEVNGKITSMLVENGDPVEYGQKLFRVEPA